MEEVNFQEIEKKWQDKWKKRKAFEVKEDSRKKKYYVLEQFPYPSGTGLHIGHAFIYTIGDIYARFKRMNGFNVLYPMGYDSLGLPAENAAIKEKVHPKDYTDKAIKNFIKQQKALGLSYDWSRVFSTHDPKYYKWDQWIFLKMFEKGLVYQKKSPVNFCRKCNTVLANEQVHDGKCWRHENTNVEIKHLNQWYFKITDYAEELADFETVKEWPDLIKKLQKNWIGKSHGSEIEFEIENPERKNSRINIKNVAHFRETISINSKLKIKGKEFSIKEIVKFRFNDGNYYMKLFLDNSYVLADDLGENSFILVKENKTGLKINEGKIKFSGKMFDFIYKAHAVAEETYGEDIFKKGESENFWDYSSKDGSYLSLGVIDKTKERLDFYGEIIYSKDLEVVNKNEFWPIFTTRPDTVFGVTFMVISAQHPRLMELVTPSQKKEVEKFVKKLSSVSQEEIEQLDKEGVFTGSYAINSINNEKVPVYAGNFVLADYGCGMVMAVPAHDERDFEFAKKYKIPVKVVIQPEASEKLKNFPGSANSQLQEFVDYNINPEKMSRAYTGDGRLVNSGEFNGMNNREAIFEITKFLEKKRKGKFVVNYKLRDWLISRQRYWGTPIPIVHCSKCGTVPVNEKDLPVELPYKVKFGKGNPLKTAEKWIKTKCPKCKGVGKRETDTMDTFVNSSWYYLRYCDSKNDKEIFDKKKAGYWIPIDMYIGGKEHACMHDIYIRFYTKFLRDLKLVKISEPAVKLFVQGMVHGEDGNKMSKSLGNVIDPLDTIKKYSADALRLFLVSVASPDSDFNWSDRGIQGSFKFVNKLFDYFNNYKEFGKSSEKLESKINKAVKEISEDIENFRYNLAVIKIRELFDKINGEKKISKKDLENFLKIFSVFCPHIAEELWEKLGNKIFISLEKWPIADENKINEKLEKEERAIDLLIMDIRNILNILEKKGETKKKISIFVIPDELGLYKEAKEKVEDIFNLKTEVLSVKEASKTGKIIKARPGKPGLFLE